MKLISKKVHDRLLKSANKAKVRFADQLLVKKVPVSARVAKEIGIPISPEAQAAIIKQDRQKQLRGTSSDVVCQVKLSVYLEALEKYEPDPDPAEVETPVDDETPATN